MFEINDTEKIENAKTQLTRNLWYQTFNFFDKSDTPNQIDSEALWQKNEKKQSSIVKKHWK